MSDKQAEIKAIIQRVEETLETAKHGLSDLLDPSRTRWRTGLRNLITFGRSVTFVIQNLRGVRDVDFDSWYEPHQTAMKADPLMRYFVDARNELEKQGKLSVATSTHIKSFSSSDIRKFGRPPVGAQRFFIGDTLGGTGWEVELADGTTEKYYVDLPASIGEVKQQFTNFPAAKAPELAGKSVEELCTMYIDKLQELVTRAKSHFLEEPEQPKPARSRSHLRVVK
ncbi:hypothetical protein [uncultured Limnohabitans sp.]|jgi:hypothetical protein|uniref:hypothetical protein n=1 Tax=uncultured Limnohabitans sp. TaxID=768543 RepID=UPI00261FBC83|nr:hypothetical protein [uncultured Limnohabitans sp.]